MREVHNYCFALFAWFVRAAL